jgi:HSP20 family protein
MMTTRFAPFRDLELATRPRLVPSGGFSAGVPFDAVRTDDAVELTFDLPGYSPESIELSVDRNVLTLTAERSWSTPEGASVLVSERRHGAVRRQLRLSEALDTSMVEARFDNGVLRVRIPVAEAAQPHKVEITVGSSPLVEAASVEAGDRGEGDEQSN